MELYTLDSLLRRTRVIDKYKSLIWTERWQEAGDFELVLESTSEFRRYLPPGTWLSLDRSYRIMRVETIEDEVTEEGDKILTVKGPSIEIIMDDRVARYNLENLTDTETFYVTNLPAETAREIFDVVCVTGALDTDDIIPFITATTIFPTDSIPEPSTSVVSKIELVSVYEAIRKICVDYDMGFRLCLVPDMSQLVFDIYMGSDRTTDQAVLDPVVFSPDFDNLKNTKELTSNAGEKNVAYVYSPAGYVIVFAPGVDVDVAGFERKVLIVTADDIEVGDPNATTKMTNRGLEELSRYRDFSAFDGETSQFTPFVYDTDYFLGDIVEMRNRDGDANFMRVTEHIYVNDEGGFRSYPTLVVRKFISPDTWLGWPDFVWFDYDSDSLTWDDLDT